ncbi:Hypothetical protein, putative [Bodo saltans]|uniref:TerD domain-containing protein n=1 Tax=Bodo saltans TaxID=75058 RepID=A0A0S4JMX7_BODSA|nr:Hypothetical protein, putative [Bodo saltans]|eukprot:CUG92877.1 Hypothetical protein, putative [Bodo saltans]
MEFFSHEEFIRAARMEGKEVRVTVEDALRLSASSKNHDKDKAGMQSRWNEALEREAADRELATRKLRKQAQAELGNLHNRKSTPVPFAASSTPPVPLASSTPPVPQTAASTPVPFSAASSAQVLDQDNTKESDASSCKPQTLPLSQEYDINKAAQSLESVDSRLKVVNENSNEIRVEMWWQGNIDLDLSCVLIDNNNRRCGVFFFGETELNRAFHHSGDMLAGPKPGGASERVTVLLRQVSQEVKFVYFVMTAFSADSCGDVEKLLVRIVDGIDSKTLLGDTKTISERTRAALLCRLERESSETFTMKILETTFDHGDTVLSLTREIELHAATL